MAYIKCDSCGNKIQMGRVIYQHPGLCGTYCSLACYAKAFAESRRLTKAVIDNCMLQVYEEGIEC